MAEVEETLRAAGQPWCGVMYRRTNYIHEMSCGEVGAHLYGRMCCAGKVHRAAGYTVHLSTRLEVGGPAGRGGQGAEEAGVNLLNASAHTKLEYVVD